MNSWPALSIVLRLLLTLAVPAALVMGAARLLLSEQFLSLEYRRPGFPIDTYGFSLDDRLEYGSYAINYLFNGESIAYLAALRLPGDLCRNVATGASDCSLFSARELKHMEDVKALATVAFVGALLCAALAGASIMFSAVSANLRAEVWLGIRRGGQATLLSIGSLAILAIAAWDNSFAAFHELFFAAGSWRFPFSDSLIRLYPEQLFVDAAMIIAALASLGAVLILFFSSRLEGLARRRR